MQHSQRDDTDWTPKFSDLIPLDFFMKGSRTKREHPSDVQLLKQSKRYGQHRQENSNVSES